jgi:small conductance mechanosensitive channel
MVNLAANRTLVKIEALATLTRVSVFAAALAFLLVSSLRAAPAQVPIPIPVASEPASSHGIAVKRVGGYDTASVRFDGKKLFDIAAVPANAADVIPPIASRVQTVEDNLRRILPPPEKFYEAPRTRFDPQTFRVEIEKRNGYPTLYATDANRAEVAPIITVTEADALIHGLPPDELAEEWRDVLQQTLQPAIEASAPERVAGELRKIPFVVLVALALTWLMLWVRRRLNRRSGQVFQGAAWLLSWGTLLLWLLVVLWILSVLPATRGSATTFSRRIALIAALWFGIVVVNYLSRLALIEFGRTWGFNPFLSPEDAARRVLRRPMIVTAIDDLKNVVLYLIGILATLSILRLSPTSVLTIGAIVALVVGFAAQSVVKDYVAGFLILAEDQYAVGDQVTVNGIAGAVEALTLRITQIRTDTGTLVTLPNGTILMAENATRSWSRIDFRVAIALDSDVEKALGLLKRVLDDFAATNGRAAVLEPPQVLGVESMSASGIVLRAWIKVRPTERRAAFSEINRRVVETFRNAGIAIAVPETRLMTRNT